MKKGELFLRKHSSTILTVVGSIGVIATTVLAVKATPKAMKLIEDEKHRREEGKTIFDNDQIYYEKIIVPDLTILEKVKIAWKPYIPTLISCTATIACIFGAHYLSRRSQASLMSAYALLNNTYREYHEKTKELYPEKSTTIEHEIIKSKFNPDMELEEGKELFFDFQAMRYFQSTFEEVKNAEYLLNQQLTTVGYACLNDFYDILHLDRVPYGYQLGWSTMSSDKIYAYSEILLDFNYEKVEMEGGLECNIMTISYPPSLEYMC